MHSNETHKISYLDEDYTIIKNIGQSYNTKVKLAQKNGKLQVIKRLSPLEPENPQLQALIAILQDFSHPNVAIINDIRSKGLYRSYTGAQYECCAIIGEYLPHNLFEYLALSGRFSEKVARTYFRMLISGLQAIHVKGLCHGDLTSQSVLLDSKYNLKLTSFAFHALPPYNNHNTNKQGTVLSHYVAPELLNTAPCKGPVCTPQSQIFAAGVILFTLYSGVPPFASPSDPHYKLLINHNTVEQFWKNHSKKRPPGFFSPHFQSLITQMLALDPHARPTASSIKTHPWYLGEDQIPAVLTQAQLKLEFDNRKQMVAKRQAQERAIKEERRKARDLLFFNPQNRLTNRSGGEGYYYDILERSVIAEGSLPAVGRKTDSSDLVLKLGSHYFLACLIHFLEHKEKNLIYSEDESFEVTHEANKVTIKVSNSELDTQVTFTVDIILSEVSKQSILVEFRLPEETEPLEFYRVANLIKEQFEYARVE